MVTVSKLIRDAMGPSAAIHIVSPAEFDPGTKQTPGSERRAAIAPALGITSAIWGGLFEVAPGSRTGIHHHGEQETIAYVPSGTCEIRWAPEENRLRAPRPAIFFTSPPFCCTWKSILRSWSRFDGLSCAAQRHPLSSTFRTTPGRKPDLPAGGLHRLANMRQSWTRMNPIQNIIHSTLPAAR